MQRKLVTVSEYARLRGLNRSTINRQVRSGQIPTVTGKIDPLLADRAREQNLDQTRREQAARRKADAQKDKRAARVAVHRAPVVDDSNDSAAAVVRDLADDAVYRERLATLRRIVGCDQQTTFARVAVKMGCSREQAFALGSWFGCQPCLVTDIHDADLENVRLFPSPSDEEWRDALGDFDIDAADMLFTRSTV